MSSTPEFQQEEERVDRRWMLITWAFLIPFVFVLAAVAKGLFTASSRDRAAAGVRARPDPAPEVSNVRAELFRREAAGERLKRRQRTELEHFGWVDRQRGIVRLPIDVAMDLVGKESR